MKRARPQKRSSQPARTALVQIEKPIYGGAFLARVDGKATFVPLTLPGEEARVFIVEDKRSYAIAEPEEIVKAAPDRVAPQCPHFGACGGCNYQHAAYDSQLAFKQTILRETFERAGVPAPENIPVLAADPWHYRNRIRLAFDRAGRVGYRGRRSHDVVPIEECPIAAPLLIHAALSAAELLRGANAAFKPTEIALFCNADESQLLASIFVTVSVTQGFAKFSEAWKERVPAIAGVELIEEGSQHQGPKQVARWGEPSITHRAGGLDYRVDHGAFFQVNRWLIDALLQRVAADRHGDLAWDLFAGVGLFSRRLAERFAKVVAVESAPHAKLALADNLEGTSGRSVDSDTLSFLRSQRRAERPGLIVVDPPRAGLGPETTTLLAEIAAPEIVYVSCDPATLTRDLKALLASGYSLGSVTLVDLFPQTFHIETAVTLARS